MRKEKFICKDGSGGGSHCMAQASGANTDEAEELYLYCSTQSSMRSVSRPGCSVVVNRCPHAKNRPCVPVQPQG